MNNKEVAQKVVDRILDLIETEKSLPWVKPWNRKVNTVRVVDGKKVITLHPTAWNRKGEFYKGANVYLPSGEYITFKQCKAEGGNVRKGAHGFPVVYWNFVKKTETDPETGEQVEHVVPFLKYYTVFRVSDCEGIEQKHHPAPRQVEIVTSHEEMSTEQGDRNPEAEAVIADYIARAGNGFEVRTTPNSNEAYYTPTFDYVEVPVREQFSNLSEYYSTLFHELGHSTGHRTRLNRFTGKAANASFGSQEYSREELVAETCAASILNALGLEDGNSFRNSAAYIKSWSSKIKADPMMYVTATTRAQAAFDLILGITEEATEGGEE